MEDFLFGVRDFVGVVCVSGDIWWEASVILMVQWVDTGGRQSFALEALKKAFARNQKGEPTFQGWGYREAQAMLVDDVEFSLSLPAAIRLELVQRAIWDAGKLGKFDAVIFLEQLQIGESEYLQKQLSSYRILTSVSVSGVTRQHRNRWMGDVVFRNAGKFGAAQESLEDDIRRYVPFPRATFYQPVLVEVEARGQHDAMENGLARLDLVRAIWNFYFNRQYSTRESFGVPTHINKVLLGPIHTLHYPSGKLAAESIYYEPRYVGPVSTYNWSSDFSSLSKFFLRVERRLAAHNERLLIENALVDYVRALDLRDDRLAFLELWSLLERLVGSKDPIESKKITIRRASFLFPKDHEYAAALLKRLTERRNELIHGRRDIPNLEASLHHIRRFVEASIEFLLDNKFSFKTHREFLEFLELPKDLKDVSRRLRLLAQAKSHLGPPPDRKRVTEKESTPA